MFDDWAWKSYNRVIKEAREPSPFKSKAQKRFKAQRKKNDIYTALAGLKNSKSGAPYSGKVKRFGTDRLRFESLQEVVDEMDIDSLAPKEDLTPVLWVDRELRPELQEKLMQVAEDFAESMDVDLDVEDVLLVGSMAGYNYSDFSDIDLHLVVDFDKVSKDKELLRKYFHLAKSKWNRTRRRMLSGHDVEFYVEDSGDVRVPATAYSVMDGKWLSEPSKEDVSIDHEAVMKKVNEKMDEIKELQDLYESGEFKEAYEFGTTLRHKLRNFRQAGLEKDGEFSIEHLTFKMLRRAGALDKVNAYVKESYAEMRALDELQR